MQYRTGTVSVANGSLVVTGSGTDWTQLSSDSLFAIPGTPGVFRVAYVDSATQLRLATPWSNPSASGAKYWITGDFTPFHGFPMPQKNDIEVTRVLQEALLMIDQKLSPAPTGLFSVIDKDLATPPASPSEGDAYIVAANATGAWAGRANSIALYRRGSWVFFTPSDAGFVRVNDENAFYFFRSSENAWEKNALGQSGVSFFNGRVGNVTLTAGDIQAALGFAPQQGVATHTHTISDITGLQEALDAAHGSPTWASVINKPALFPTDWSLIQNKPTGNVVDWFNVTNKPTTFAPSAHAHAINDVTGLQSALDAKVSPAALTAALTWANIANKPTTFASDWATLSSKPTTFAPTAHTHAVADITGLQTQLDQRLVAFTGPGGAGWSVWQQNTFAVDQAVGDGLFNLTAGAYNTRYSATTGTGHLYQGTRGASRIGLHDNTINLYVGSKASGAPVAGEAVSWNQVANLAWDTSTFYSKVAFANAVTIGGAAPYTTASFSVDVQPTANFVVQRDSNGNIYGNYLRTTSGLYNAAGMYWIPDGGTSPVRWSIQSGHASAVGLSLKTTDGSFRGALYYDGSLGLLNQNNAWRFRTGDTYASIYSNAGTEYVLYGAHNLAPLTANTSQVIPTGALKEFQTKAGDMFGVPGQGYGGALGVIGPGQSDTYNQALMSFHRPGVFAAHFGLNSSSKWVVGGWSYGNGVQKRLWIEGEIPTNAWQNTDDGANRFYFAANGDSIYKTKASHAWRNGSDATVMTLDANGQVVNYSSNFRSLNTGGTGQFTAVSGNTMAGFYNDGTQFYILKHSSSNTAFDGHRPFYVNLTSGQVTIDGTGAGTTQIGGSLNVGGGLTTQGQISSAQYGVVGTTRSDTGFGLRVRARSDDATGVLQFTNNAQSAEWSRLYSNAAGQLRASTLFGVDGEFYANSWMRSATSGSGWYHEVHGGGIYMNDNSWVRIYGDKNFVTAGTIQMGAFTVTSDRRLKTEIKPLENYSQVIDTTNVYSFVKNGRRQWGVIAQEAQENPYTEVLVGEGATTLEDGSSALTVEGMGYVYALLAEVKDLRKRVAHLEVAA